MKALLYFLVITSFAMASCQEKTVFCGEVGEIPETFSPDGDRHEDQWRFDIRHMESWEVSVYDRWGNVQYEAVNEPVQWDGMSLSGDPAFPGTYVYILTCTDGCKGEMKTQGTVLLMR